MFNSKESILLINKEISLGYKVVTHSGKAHLDEIFAIALLSLYKGELPSKIKRANYNFAAYLIKRGIISENLYYIDCGMGFDPEKNIFDHHHEELPSAAFLVMEHYFPYLLESDLGDYIKTLSDVDNYGPSVLEDYKPESKALNFSKFPVQLLITLFEKKPIELIRVLIEAIRLEIDSITLKNKAREWLNSTGNYNIVEISGLKLLIYNYPPEPGISKYIRSMDYELINRYSIDVIYSFDPKDRSIRTLYRTNLGDNKINFNNVKSIVPIFSHNNGFLFKFKPDSVIDLGQIIEEASLLC